MSSLWIVPIVGWHHFVNGGERVVPSNVCDTEYATNTSLKIITSILNFYLPLAVMYALYTKIFLEIRHRSKLEVGQRVHFTGGRGVSMESLPRDSDDASYIDYLQINDLASRKSGSLGSTGRFACMKRRKTSVRLPPLGGSAPNPGFVEMNDKKRPQTFNDDDVIMALDIMSAADQPEVQTPPVDDSSHKDGSKDPCFRGGNEASLVKRKLNRLDSGVYLALGSPSIQDNGTGGNSGKKTKADEAVFSRSFFRKISARGRTDVVEQEVALDSSSTYGTKPILPETRRIKYQSLPVIYKNEHPVSPSRSQPENTGGDLVGVRFTVGELSDSPSDDEDNENRHETRFPQEMHPSKNHLIRRRLKCASIKSKNSDQRQLSLVSNQQPEKQQHPVDGHVPNRRHLGAGDRSASFDQHHRMESSTVLEARRSQVLGVAISSKPSGKRPKKRRPVGGTSSALQRDIKAARQLGVIMGAFTVCFLPYFVCFTVVAFCDWCVGSQLMTTVTWIGYLNSAMNPFLYPLCNVSFRRKFRQMLNVVMMREKLRKLCARKYPIHGHSVAMVI